MMEHVRANWQHGDVVYLFPRPAPVFEYYAGRYGFEPRDVVTRVGDDGPWQDYVKDLERLRASHRAWVVCSGTDAPRNAKVFRRHVGSTGTRVRSFCAPGASAHLYRFGQPRPTGDPDPAATARGSLSPSRSAFVSAP